MKIYRIIDKETNKFLRDDTTFNKETEIALDVKPASGLYEPMWDVEKWIEGKSDEELATLKAEQEAKATLQANIDYLSSTKYVEENYNILLKVDEEKAEQYLASTSNTYGITVQEILKKRAEIVTSIATF